MRWWPKRLNPSLSPESGFIDPWQPLLHSLLLMRLGNLQGEERNNIQGVDENVCGPWLAYHHDVIKNTIRPKPRILPQKGNIGEGHDKELICFPLCWRL